MSDNTPKPKSKFRLSRILRFTGIGILLAMVILSIVFQFTQPEVLTDEESIAATVQAGVNAGLTEVVMQTGTPDATAIQATVDAGIEATLASIDSPPQSETSNTAGGTEYDGVVGWIVGFFEAIWGFVLGIWNFAGRGGIFVQVCCCIVPIGLVALGIIND